VPAVLAVQRQKPPALADVAQIPHLEDLGSTPENRLNRKRPSGPAPLGLGRRGARRRTRDRQAHSATSGQPRGRARCPSSDPDEGLVDRDAGIAVGDGVLPGPRVETVVEPALLATRGRSVMPPQKVPESCRLPPRPRESKAPGQKGRPAPGRGARALATVVVVTGTGLGTFSTMGGATAETTTVSSTATSSEKATIVPYRARP